MAVDSVKDTLGLTALDAHACGRSGAGFGAKFGAPGATYEAREDVDLIRAILGSKTL
jgi:hypothetical protein